MSFLKQLIAYSKEEFNGNELKTLKECFNHFLNAISDCHKTFIIKNTIEIPKQVFKDGELFKGFKCLEKKGLTQDKYLLPKAYLYYETLIQKSHRYSNYICQFLEYFKKNLRGIISGMIYYNNAFMEQFKRKGLNDNEIVFLLFLLNDLRYIKLSWGSPNPPHPDDPLYGNLKVNEVTEKGFSLINNICIIKKHNDVIRFIKRIVNDYLDENYFGIHLKILANKIEQNKNKWLINYIRMDLIKEKSEGYSNEAYSTDKKAIFFQDIVEIDNIFAKFSNNGYIYENEGHQFFFNENLSIPGDYETFKSNFNTNFYQYSYIKCNKEVNLIFQDALYSPNLDSYYQKVVDKKYFYNENPLNGMTIIKRFIGFSFPMDNIPSPLILIVFPINSFIFKLNKDVFNIHQDLEVNWDVKGRIKDLIYLTYKKGKSDPIRIKNIIAKIKIEDNLSGILQFEVSWLGTDDLLPNGCILYKKEISYMKNNQIKREKADDKESNEEFFKYLEECLSEPTPKRAEHGKYDTGILIISQKLNSETENFSIVDFGCGNGRLIYGLNNLDPKVLEKLTYFGIDINQNYLDECKKIATELQFKKKIKEFHILTPDKFFELEIEVEYIFLIHVIHELKVCDLLGIMYDLLYRLKNGGNVMIHEMVELIEGEKDFISYDKDDYYELFDNKGLTIHCYSYSSRRMHNPLITVNLIKKEDITEISKFINSIKSALTNKRQRIKNEIKSLQEKTNILKTKEYARLMALFNNLIFQLDEYDEIIQGKGIPIHSKKCPKCGFNEMFILRDTNTWKMRCGKCSLIVSI